MSITYTIIGFIAGVLTTTCTIVQSGIIIFFGIPFTEKLHAEDKIKNTGKLQARYLITLIFLLVLFSAVTAGVLIFYSRITTGYIFGVVTALLFSVSKMGITEANIADYIETNAEYLKDEYLQELD